MKKMKIIVVIMAVVIVLSIALLFDSMQNIQVIGKLPPDDLQKIQKVFKKELRHQILPKVEWDNFHHLDYVYRQIKEYNAQRILWVDVKEDGSVEVFAGVSKAVIRTEGYAMNLRKQPDWQITGYGYWAITNAAPHDMQIPP